MRTEFCSGCLTEKRKFFYSFSINRLLEKVALYFSHRIAAALYFASLITYGHSASKQPSQEYFFHKKKKKEKKTVFFVCVCVCFRELVKSSTTILQSYYYYYQSFFFYLCVVVGCWLMPFWKFYDLAIVFSRVSWSLARAFCGRFFRYFRVSLAQFLCRKNQVEYFLAVLFLFIYFIYFFF